MLIGSFSKWRFCKRGRQIKDKALRRSQASLYSLFTTWVCWFVSLFGITTIGINSTIVYVHSRLWFKALHALSVRLKAHQVRKSVIFVWFIPKQLENEADFLSTFTIIPNMFLTIFYHVWKWILISMQNYRVYVYFYHSHGCFDCIFVFSFIFLKFC